ncbi:peptidase C48, SUMO/sentrin/Ubl1 [Tanacetum coccineum]
MRGLSSERKKYNKHDVRVSNGRHSHNSKNSKSCSWATNREKETGKRRLERVQRSILATVERPVQKCQQAHNKSVIRLLKNIFKGDDVSDIDWCSYIIECASVSKLDWETKLKKGRCLLWASDVLNEIQDDVGEGEEPNQTEELYEMLEENIHIILTEKSEIEEKINENLIKFQDDEKLLQLKQWMKEIFKEPDMPKYLSSSSSEYDDDNDDGSQLADENKESYRKEKHSNDEDDVEIIAEIQKDERNETHYTAEYEQETGTSKKDEADNNKEEGMANKKATNQKINEEIDPFDDPKFGEYYIQNEHLFVPTQTSAEKKKDQTDDVNWDSFLENEEEIIRKGREFSAEIRKKAQQQERERKRKGKKEKDQIGSSSQESPVFGIDNSLQAIELTEDEKLLGRSIFNTQEEEEMNIQSLAPRLEIDTLVIDVYVSILNCEEKFKMKNMKRHFFYTSMMVPGILEDKTKEIDKKIDAQYDRFHEMLLIQMENDVEKMQMEDVELAFFPIIAHGHYYLIVFNLKTGKAVIIDNSESDATYEGKYKDNVEFVRSVFGRHLLMYQNTNADKILTVAKKPTILKMKWKTKKEKIDCGLYMIMHMELYEGSTAAQWKTCLLPENDKNHRMQMDNLRSRIAAKILLHEVNIYQKKMSDYAKKMTEAGEGGSNRQ